MGKILGLEGNPLPQIFGFHNGKEVLLGICK